MRINRALEISAQTKLIDWVKVSFNKEADFYTVIITFKGRIRPCKLSSKQIIFGNNELMFESHCGRDFSVQEIRKGFHEFMRQLDFKYLPTSLRKKGIRLKVFPCIGGDRSNGTYNHIHAYIQLPNSVPFENAVTYMKKIAQNKMEEVCKVNGYVETDVWCEKCENVETKFIKYITRAEGGITNRLDKVMIEQVYL